MTQTILKRKICDDLLNWKQNPDRTPLIIKGARQIGKTFSIMQFAKENYSSVIEINFVIEESFCHIFDDGFDVDNIIKNISIKKPLAKFIPGKTLIFFDEMQKCPNCATSLKFFKLDGRYDVICSGSLMGINYNEIESNSVGYKTDYEMHSLDFEEFLWAKGYQNSVIQDMLNHMRTLTAFNTVEYETFYNNFMDYIIVGGMPAIVNTFIKNKNFSNCLTMQKQILLDYEEDIIKYANGLDKGRILNIYRKIPVFLGKENKKFQITKVEKNARSRDYVGVLEWLENAGIIKQCFNMQSPELPLKGNYDPDNFKVYFTETSLLIASLDDEAQYDLRMNKNFGIYKGAIYENIIADIFIKQNYGLYHYKNEKSTIEMDFFVRDLKNLIPVEVKASDNSTPSLNNLIKNEKFSDIKYGIKFANKNIGFNGKFYTFPYFTAFLLKKFLDGIN